MHYTLECLCTSADTGSRILTNIAGITSSKYAFVVIIITYIHCDAALMLFSQPTLPLSTYEFIALLWPSKSRVYQLTYWYAAEAEVKSAIFGNLFGN